MVQTSYRSEPLNYVLSIPDSDVPADGWPVILFLHGSGERGIDPDVVRQYGLPRFIDEGLKVPFIVLSPQCPEGETWDTQVVPTGVLMEDVLGSLPTNKHRTYVTGLSMGGHGCWFMGITYPERFAAMAMICAPVANANLERDAPVLKNMPVWIFHGEADSVVPVDDAYRYQAALMAVGNPPRMTIYPGVDHNAWDAAYGEPDFFDWLLRHQLT